MPAYAVDTSTRPRRVTRPRIVSDVPPQLPTPKPPDAVTPVYDVIPQQPQTAPIPMTAPTVPTDDPATTSLKRAAEALQMAKDAPVKKEGRLKAFLKMAAAGLGTVRPGATWTDVAMQAGAALGGGVSGAIQPKLPGAIQKDYNIHQAEGDLAQAEKFATTSSMIDRRDDQTRLAEDSLALRAQTADMNAKYKDYLMREGKRRNDSLLERQKFLTEHAKDVFADKKTQEAWVRNIGERKLSENIRQFNSRDEIARTNLVISQRRAAAYEESVKNGVIGKRADVAADVAEGEALLEAADGYSAAIEGLDPDNDYDEILALKKARIAAQRNGRAKIAAANAAGAARGISTDKTPTMPMKTAKPKSDPLGLFKP